MNGILLDFLRETLNRLFMKSPKYFKIWQTISLVCLLIVGIPEFFHQIDIEIPQLFNHALSKAISFAASSFFIMSKLVVQSTASVINEKGKVLKETDSDKLPLTAKAENKVSATMDLPKVTETK